MLADEIQQSRPFASLAEEAFLNLQRTAGLQQQALARVLKVEGLTPTQYNVLRILRGSDPNGLTCSEIGERMVTPGPDVTRMVERLARQGLAQRLRDEQDRRVVRVTITDSGRDLLARLDEPVQQHLERTARALPAASLRRLIRLLEALRRN